MRRPLALAAGLAPALLAARAHAEGMPQLDFGNPLTLAQIVWLAIIFAVLYVLLSRWALPQVAAVLELRAARIATDLEAARQSKTEADAAVADLTQATRDAHASAQAAIAEAVASAKQAAEAETARLNERLEAQLAAAEQRIGRARASALAALEQVAVETTQVVVARLTGAPVERDAVARHVATATAAWRARTAQA